MAKIRVHSKEHYSSGEFVALPSGYLDIYTLGEFVNSLKIEHLSGNGCSRDLTMSVDFEQRVEKLQTINAEGTRFFADWVENLAFNKGTKEVPLFLTNSFEEAVEAFYEQSGKFLEEIGHEAKVVRLLSRHDTNRYFFFEERDWQIFLKQDPQFPLTTWGGIYCFNEQRSLKVFDIRGYVL